MIEGLPFTITDIVVLGGILLVGILASVWGFVGLVTGIGAWIGALVVAVIGYPHAQKIARQHIEQELFADIGSGIALFAGALIIFLVLSSILSHMTKESRLGSINRALGFVTGLALGYVLACVFLLGGIMLLGEEQLPREVKDSRSYTIVRQGGVEILEALPENVSGTILKKLEQGRELKDQVQKTEELREQILQPPTEGDNAERAPEKGYTETDNNELDNLSDTVGN